MFNRRELVVSVILATMAKPTEVIASQETERLPEGFVIDESAGPITPEVMRELRWSRAGVITVFSPDGKHVFTARRTDDLAQIWDSMTGAELKFLHPFKIEWGSDWVSYSDDGSEILVTAKDGTVRRLRSSDMTDRKCSLPLVI